MPTPRATPERPATGASSAIGAARVSATTESQPLRKVIEDRLVDQRLTPGQRRIAQCLIDSSSEIGFLSSQEIATLANVSQPSVTRFARTLGFHGFLDMRRQLRTAAQGASAPQVTKAKANRFQSAALAEAANVAELAATLADGANIAAIGKALAASRPLPVLGLRASGGLAAQFCYYAAKVHPDVRLLVGGGSLIEDQIEQAHRAGATALLSFMMPLYPRETVSALRHAHSLGLNVALVTDASFAGHQDLANLVLRARVHSSLTFDSYAAVAVLVAVILDAMCDAMPGGAQARLEDVDRSSARRKVFVR